MVYPDSASLHPGYDWAIGEPKGEMGYTSYTLALLTIAVAAPELGQTIVEEEVQGEAHMSAPMRVRRFLSRFLVVVVSLSIEAMRPRSA